MEKMVVIHTDKAPAAVGPYSQAIKFGNLVFASGQMPLDPITGEMVRSDITVQAKQVMENLSEVLTEAGASLGSVVKTTCFLSDMANYAAFNEVYAQHFTGKPARSCFAVKTLPKNALCEIEAIAAVTEDK